MTNRNAATKWYDTSKRGFLLDFQIPDSFDQVPLGQLPTLRNIDPEKIVAQLKDAGVTHLYTHARDYSGNCYYNTRVGHKHTGIGERDLLDEFSRICRRAGMKILFYVYLAQSHEPRRDCYAERDFAAIDADGKRRTGMSMCPNGAGREYIKALLSEISSNYDFDGYWLDCLAPLAGKDICYCDTCKAKFLADTGGQLPRPDDQSSADWRRYIGWIRRQNMQLKREFGHAIRTANPKLTIAYNAGGATHLPHTSFEQCDDDDYVCREFHYGSGLAGLTMNCLKCAATKEGSALFETEVWRFFTTCEGGMGRGNQTRPVPMLFTEMATTLAHGGIIQYYDNIQMDGRLDGRSLDALKAAYAEAARREPFIPGGQERVQYASIVWSKATDGYGAATPAREHSQEAEGFMVALMERAILCDVITDRAVRAGKFGGARAVILPSVACLSEEEASNLRAYVEGGGGLVATYRTSLQDETGSFRANFGLADLFGADYLEQLSYKYSFVKFGGKHAICEGLPADWPMSVYDTWQLKVSAHKSAQCHGNIVHPFRGNKMGAFPGEDTPYPAVITQKVGKGRVVYIPHPLGWCYKEYGHPDMRQLLVNAVRWAANAPLPVEVEGPDTLEVVLWKDQSDARHMLHLVNRTAAGPARARGSVFERSIPVHDVKIRFPFKVSRATLQPEGLELDVKFAGGKSELLVPRLDIYSIIVARR